MATSKLLRFGYGLFGLAVLVGEAIKLSRKISLKDRNVLIMGGSRGLALEIARVCLERGAKVALAARDEHELQEAKRLLESKGLVEVFVCDATHENAVRRTITEVSSKLGEIDVLINNEGLIEVGPAEEQTKRDFSNSMNTHFWGPLFAIEAVLPEMKSRRFGRIVNIASVAGLMSVPHLLPYSASKHALVGLSEGFRSELIKDNIYVTTVCPGLMRTGSPRNADIKGQNDIEYALFDLMDSLPFTSINAQTAAQKIVNACENGDALLVVSIQAQLARAVHAAFPGAVTELFAWANRFLPGPGGIGSNTAKGKESESKLAPSVLTKLSDEAAVRNNEMG